MSRTIGMFFVLFSYLLTLHLQLDHGYHDSDYDDDDLLGKHLASGKSEKAI